jgi:hypothetical protein
VPLPVAVAAAPSPPQAATKTPAGRWFSPQRANVHWQHRRRPRRPAPAEPALQLTGGMPPVITRTSNRATTSGHELTRLPTISVKVRPGGWHWQCSAHCGTPTIIGDRPGDGPRFARNQGRSPVPVPDSDLSGTPARTLPRPRFPSGSAPCRKPKALQPSRPYRSTGSAQTGAQISFFLISGGRSPAAKCRAGTDRPAPTVTGTGALAQAEAGDTATQGSQGRPRAGPLPIVLTMIVDLRLSQAALLAAQEQGSPGPAAKSDLRKHQAIVHCGNRVF